MQIIKNLTVVSRARKQYFCDGYVTLIDSVFNAPEETKFRFSQLPEVIQKGEEYYYLKEKTDEGVKGKKVNKKVYQFLTELNLITFI